MITQELFEKIKNKYGQTSSWAIWSEKGDKPTSNIGCLDVLNPHKNGQLLETLTTQIVMVGLNISTEGRIVDDFSNFHSKHATAKDYKIRAAFRGTPYWGAYMTDVIKNFPEKSSGDVVKHFKARRDELDEHLLALKTELECIGSPMPTLLAFGSDTEKYLKLGCEKGYWGKPINIGHYSAYGGADDYRKKVHHKLTENHLPGFTP